MFEDYLKYMNKFFTVSTNRSITTINKRLELEHDIREGFTGKIVRLKLSAGHNVNYLIIFLFHYCDEFLILLEYIFHYSIDKLLYSSLVSMQVCFYDFLRDFLTK